MGVYKDDKGMFLVLNSTIFHPQGGGQPTGNIAYFYFLSLHICFDFFKIVFFFVQKNKRPAFQNN